MKRGLRNMLLIASISLPLINLANASKLTVRPVARTSQGYLAIQFQLDDPFEGTYLEALQSGLPTTLSFTLEIWRQRTGWWDKLEEVVDFEYKMYRDLLSEEYIVVTEEDKQAYTNIDALILGTCVFTSESPQGYLHLPFRPNGRTPVDKDLPLDQTYYVIITANLAPLTVEDLNELDDWIQGSIRGGGKRSPGGLSGLTRTMGGLLMSMTGFGDRTTRARTERFSPAKIQRRLRDSKTSEPLPVPARKDSVVHSEN